MLRIKILRSLFFVVLLSFCQPIFCANDNLTSLIIYPPEGYAGDQFYLVSRRDNDWLLMISSELMIKNIEKYKINFYNLKNNDLEYSYAYKGNDESPLDKAFEYIESTGLKVIRNIRREMAINGSDIEADGWRYLSVGEFKIVNNVVNTCESSLVNNFSIWSETGEYRIGKYVIVIRGRFNRPGDDTCYKMFGNKSEVLNYMTLEMDKAWDMGNGTYGISFKNIPSFIIFDNGVLHFPATESMTVSQINYDEYMSIYEKFRVKCELPTDRNKVTMDECINEKLKSDNSFLELFEKNIEGRAINGEQ